MEQISYILCEHRARIESSEGCHEGECFFNVDIESRVDGAYKSRSFQATSILEIVQQCELLDKELANIDQKFKRNRLKKQQAFKQRATK